MKTQRFAIGLTVINLVLLIFLLAQIHHAEAQEAAPVLRGRALQIVDAQGRIRAEILVHGPETVNSKTYPETVLFRMADPKSGPVVKMTASERGAALGLSDDATGRVELFANREKGNFLKVVSREGREQVIKPWASSPCQHWCELEGGPFTLSVSRLAKPIGKSDLYNEEILHEFRYLSIAAAFCSHRFAVTYPYMADEIKWNIVGREELMGREAVIARCAEAAKFLETVSTTFTKLKINRAENCVVVEGAAQFQDQENQTAVGAGVI